jgi:large subunit ribosomal protein L53
MARLGLRAVKQVRVQFCPFEKNVESTRYRRTGRGGARLFSPSTRCSRCFSHRRTFLQAVSSEKVRSTNLNCSVIADVRHDGSEPCVDVLFGGLA